MGARESGGAEAPLLARASQSYKSCPSGTLFLCFCAPVLEAPEMWHGCWVLATSPRTPKPPEKTAKKIGVNALR